MLDDTNWNLPSEYASCLQSARVTVQVVKQQEKLLHLDTVSREDTRRYLAKVMTNDLSVFLHALHDIAEDRVLRRERLTEDEISYIQDVTDLYDLLFHHVLPELRLNTAHDVIVVLENEPLCEEDEDHRLLSEDVVKKAIEAVTSGEPLPESCIVSEEELEIATSLFLNNQGERMQCHSFVVEMKKGGKERGEGGGKKSSSRKSLRYLLLSNQRLLCTRHADLVKWEVPLVSIKKTHINKHGFMELHTNDGRTFVFASSQMSTWNRELMAALADMRAALVESDQLLQEQHSLEGEEECYDITVYVGSAEDLQEHPNDRTHCPYFYLGVGAATEFGGDRRSRQRSSTKDGTLSPTFNESFNFSLTSQHAFMLDIVLMSQQASGRTDFCLGMVRLSLDELFISHEHSLRLWEDVQIGDSRSRGRLYVRLTLNGFSGYRVPEHSSYSLPALQRHSHFFVHAQSPHIMNECNTVVATLQRSQKAITLLDAASMRAIYTLERSSLLKKEYVVSDNVGIFGRFYRKLSSIRRKKLRLKLLNGEILFYLSGDFSNEVYVQNAMMENIASVVLGEGDFGTKGRVIIVNILLESVDVALILMFALYVLER